MEPRGVPVDATGGSGVISSGVGGGGGGGGMIREERGQR